MRLSGRLVRIAIALRDRSVRAAQLVVSDGNPIFRQVLPAAATGSGERRTAARTSRTTRPATNRRSQFYAQHRKFALVALQLEFGQVDLPEVWDHDHVSVSAQFRAIGLDILYQGTQYDALRFRKLIAGEPVIPLPEKFRYVRLRFSPQESRLHHFTGLLILRVFLLERCKRA